MTRLALLFALALTACVTPAVPDAPRGAAPLAWLSGCWQVPGGGYREVWSAPDHGFLFGYALTLRDGEAVFFEQSRIETGETAIFYAYPAGTGPSPFRESAQTETSITFAAPEHDYPQIVAYERTESGLHAHISMIDGSERRDFDFAACPG